MLILGIVGLFWKNLLNRLPALEQCKIIAADEAVPLATALSERKKLVTLKLC